MRLAKVSDINDIMNIIKATIKIMETENNPQWNSKYPIEKDFLNDIKLGHLYVYEDSAKKAVAVYCLNHIEPVEYADVDWSLKKPAIVIHRMAILPEYRRRGIGTKMMEFAEKVAKEKGINYIKVDTYSENSKMNSLFIKNGYNKVGIVYFRNKPKEFNCYDKIIGG